MKELKTLIVNGNEYIVTDPNAARIDDAAAGQAVWSSKNMIDRLCPAFSESGAVAVCEPVEGYPLTVTAKPEATKIVRCGKNLYKHQDYEFMSGDFTATKTETGYCITGTYSNGCFILVPLGRLADLSGKCIALSADIVGTAASFQIVVCSPDYSNRTSISIHNGRFKIPQASAHPEGYIVCVRFGGNVSHNTADVVTYDNIQAEIGETVTAYEPFTCFDTFTPGEDIPALSGTNVLYADNGEITVTGKANPAAIIEKLTNAIIALGGNV